jgi:hypothetical protein
LAVLEGPETIEDEGLAGTRLRPSLFMEEQAMTAEAVRESSDRGVGDPELAGDLAESGAGDETMKGGLEEVGALQPVGGGEGL